jgi:DNA-binding transcriptional LysR family regulator
VKQQLEQGEIDLCITSPPIEQAGIGWISLMREEIYLMVPPDHRLGGRTSIHLREVEHEPFISLKPGNTMRDLTDNCCRQAGFVPRVAFEGDEPSTLRGLVTAGLGVAFISELVLRNVADPSVIVPLRIEEPRCDRIIGLAWRKEHYLSQAAQYFLDFVVQYFKNIEQ